MAIIAKKTIVSSRKKLATIEPPDRQKEIKPRVIETEEPVLKNHILSNEKSFLVHKPSQFMHDMLNEQNKQE